MKSEPMQWISEKRASAIVYNKPCLICGQPSCCAVRDYGVAPACMTHGLVAQRLGYIVAFPEVMSPEEIRLFRQNLDTEVE